MSTTTIELKKLYHLEYYTYIILIHFKILVSCVSSNPQSPVAVVLKASISIGTFVKNLSNLIDDLILIDAF